MKKIFMVIFATLMLLIAIPSLSIAWPWYTTDLKVVGDRGDGVLDEIANIGICPGGDNYIAMFGKNIPGYSQYGAVGQSYDRPGLYGNSTRNYGTVGRSIDAPGVGGISVRGPGVYGEGQYGLYGKSNNNDHALFADGTSYLGGEITISEVSAEPKNPSFGKVLLYVEIDNEGVATLLVKFSNGTRYKLAIQSK